MSIPTRRIVIFFDPDADGGSADYFTRLRYKNDPTVIIKSVMLGHGRKDVHHETVIGNIQDGDEVHFYDTTPSDDELSEMIYRGLNDPTKKPLSKIVIRDHHATEVARIMGFQIDHYFKAPVTDFDMDASAPSAAHMVWDMYRKESGGPLEGRKPPELLDFIDKIEKNNLETRRERAIAAFVDQFFGRGTDIDRVGILYGMSIKDIQKYGKPILLEHEIALRPLPSRTKYAPLDLGPDPKYRNSIVPIVNARLPDYGRSIERVLKRMALTNEFGIACAYWIKSDGTLERPPSVKMSVRGHKELRPDMVVGHLKYKFGATGGGSVRWAAIEFENMDIFKKDVRLFDTPQAAKAAVPHLRYAQG